MIQACILAISSQLPFQDEKILIISINSLSKFWMLLKTTAHMSNVIQSSSRT
ncbi:hypothetical protein PVAP13_9KG176613 [Panicum virgatum]|uniref:Uncharacterized protein n=1 Tax=Panicum virgatum TaxID=38727 RepID=A0A8T0NKT1_PANVG|nr:hypothetical protein PVAP13_9KG176613 [Panicum virgatum]